MTSPIEKIVAIVAPHRCLGCGSEDNILCTVCQLSHIISINSFCILCSKPSAGWQLCPVCQQQSGLQCVWVGGAYQGLLEKMIKKYKFERARAAHEPLARILAAILPPGDWQLVPVPTAPVRVRQRGYDQVLLIARTLSRLTGMPLSPLLRRTHDSRQVGANRATRLAQSQNAFYVARTPLTQRPILLIDDVCTTGATLSAAAKVLHQAGAIEVDAAVCAWQSAAV